MRLSFLLVYCCSGPKGLILDPLYVGGQMVWNGLSSCWVMRMVRRTYIRPPAREVRFRAGSFSSKIVLE